MSEPVPEHFKNCATCKKPIHFGATYFRCSVSTCQRKQTDFAFCTQECWDSHVPTFRHKDAWALHVTSPTAVEFAQHARAMKQEEEERTAAAEKRSEPPVPVGDVSDDDILIVASKLKAYIRAKSGMNTSADVLEVLSDRVRALADQAVVRAGQSGRKTVMGRDF